MKRRYLFLLLALLNGATIAAAHAAVLRTQTLALKKGWNAVALEVQPLAARPAEVFAGQPVEIVAAFIPGQIGEEYLRNPGDAPWKEEGWAVWYAPGRTESFLSNLATVQAGRPMLVLASSDVSWNVSGTVQATTLTWQPDTCTFTALPVDPAGGPTFAQFFAGSTAHSRMRIFRLEAGSWKLVRDPATERAKSGEAYWIHTDGVSRYQGPLHVSMPASGEMAFQLRGVRRELLFRNDAASPANVRIESLVSGEALPLRVAQRVVSKLRVERTVLPSILALPTLTANASTTLTLEPDRDRMTSTELSQLLRITDGRGVQLFIPVSARRAGPVPAPAPTTASAAGTSR